MLEDPLSGRPADTAGPQHTAEAVCRTWYEAYGTRLYSYLRFHLPSSDLAEDLTAEVFLRALQGFPGFDPSRGTPRAWLFRIARNALSDHQRQDRRRRMVPIAVMHDLECEAPSPEERLLWEEEVSRLLAGMAELSPGDREIIGLCYGSELSMAEAGEVLGVSPSTTRTRLWRALGRLRKVMAQ